MLRAIKIPSFSGITCFDVILVWSTVPSAHERHPVLSVPFAEGRQPLWSSAKLASTAQGPLTAVKSAPGSASMTHPLHHPEDEEATVKQ